MAHKKPCCDVKEGVNHAGKSTASKFASTRKRTPKANKPDATRNRNRSGG